MAKMIKVTINEEKKNPLSAEEKTQCSKEVLSHLQKYFEDGKTLKTNGHYYCSIREKSIRVEWVVEEEGALSPEMVEKADIFVRNNEVLDDGDGVYKNKYLNDVRVLEYSKNMPKSRSTAFFMLSAYIHGYDIEHVEEVKKMKAGEHIDPDILKEIYTAGSKLSKQMQKDEVTDAIDNLLKAMYTKDYQETKGVQLEDKNKLDKKSHFDIDSEYKIEDYSNGNKEVAKVIDVDCEVGNDKLNSDERYKFAKIVQKECDKAINNGITKGHVSHTFPNGTEVKARWHLNENKEYIANLKSLREKTNKVHDNIQDIFKNTSPQVKMGMILKTALKLGYDMPYKKEADNFMMGIEPSNDMKGKIADITVDILERIVKENKHIEAARFISDMVLSSNN